MTVSAAEILATLSEQEQTQLKDELDALDLILRKALPHGVEAHKKLVQDLETLDDERLPLIQAGAADAAVEMTRLLRFLSRYEPFYEELWPAQRWPRPGASLLREISASFLGCLELTLPEATPGQNQAVRDLMLDQDYLNWRLALIKTWLEASDA